MLLVGERFYPGPGRVTMCKHSRQRTGETPYYDGRVGRASVAHRDLPGKVANTTNKKIRTNDIPQRLLVSVKDAEAVQSVDSVYYDKSNIITVGNDIVHPSAHNDSRPRESTVLLFEKTCNPSIVRHEYQQLQYTRTYV